MFYAFIIDQAQAILSGVHCSSGSSNISDVKDN